MVIILILIDGIFPKISKCLSGFTISQVDQIKAVVDSFHAAGGVISSTQSTSIHHQARAQFVVTASFL